jgi:hypothetical protein
MGQLIVKTAVKTVTAIVVTEITYQLWSRTDQIRSQFKTSRLRRLVFWK